MRAERCKCIRFFTSKQLLQNYTDRCAISGVTTSLFLRPLIPGVKIFWPTAGEQYTNTTKVKMQGLHFNFSVHRLDPSYRWPKYSGRRLACTGTMMEFILFLLLYHPLLFDLDHLEKLRQRMPSKCRIHQDRRRQGPF